MPRITTTDDRMLQVTRTDAPARAVPLRLRPVTTATRAPDKITVVPAADYLLLMQVTSWRARGVPLRRTEGTAALLKMTPEEAAQQHAALDATLLGQMAVMPVEWHRALLDAYAQHAAHWWERVGSWCTMPRQGLGDEVAAGVGSTIDRRPPMKPPETHVPISVFDGVEGGLASEMHRYAGSGAARFEQALKDGLSSGHPGLPGGGSTGMWDGVGLGWGFVSNEQLIRQFDDWAVGGGSRGPGLDFSPYEGGGKNPVSKAEKAHGKVLMGDADTARSTANHVYIAAILVAAVGGYRYGNEQAVKQGDAQGAKSSGFWTAAGAALGAGIAFFVPWNQAHEGADKKESAGKWLVDEYDKENPSSSGDTLKGSEGAPGEKEDSYYDWSDDDSVATGAGGTGAGGPSGDDEKNQSKGKDEGEDDEKNQSKDEDEENQSKDEDEGGTSHEDGGGRDGEEDDQGSNYEIRIPAETMGSVLAAWEEGRAGLNGVGGAEGAEDETPKGERYALWLEFQLRGSEGSLGFMWSSLVAEKMGKQEWDEIGYDTLARVIPDLTSAATVSGGVWSADDGLGLGDDGGHPQLPARAIAVPLASVAEAVQVRARLG